MANNSIRSPRKTALALAVALFCAWQSPVSAHGDEAHMVLMDKTLQAFGADVQWDDYAQMFTLMKDGAYVKVKPGAKTAIVNGKSLDLQVPVVMKDGKAWVSDTFINDVFQSGLGSDLPGRGTPASAQLVIRGRNQRSGDDCQSLAAIPPQHPFYRNLRCTSRIKRRCGPSRLKEPRLMRRAPLTW